MRTHKKDATPIATYTDDFCKYTLDAYKLIILFSKIS